jgi:hypothetical protein
MILHFFKDEDWLIAHHSNETTTKERTMSFESRDLLSKIAGEDGGYVRLSIAGGSKKAEGADGPIYKSKGYSAMYKQMEFPNGEASYACPSVKGEPVNYYPYLCKAFGMAIGGIYPDIIYFKEV